MRPIIKSYTPADDDTDGFANDVNTTSGLPFTLAATTVGDEMAHLVIITPSGSVSGNYTITGTDADGHAQTETLATSTTNPVTSAKFYKTVTSVLAPSGIGAATVDIGWTDDVVSQTIPLDWPVNPFSVGFNVDVSGTINFTVQHTFQNVLSVADPAQGTWMPDATVASKTADTDGSFTTPVMAVRLLINSLSSGATISLTVIQAG